MLPQDAPRYNNVMGTRRVPTLNQQVLQQQVNPEIQKQLVQQRSNDVQLQDQQTPSQMHNQFTSVQPAPSMAASMQQDSSMFDDFTGMFGSEPAAPPPPPMPQQQFFNEAQPYQQPSYYPAPGFPPYAGYAVPSYNAPPNYGYQQGYVPPPPPPPQPFQQQPYVQPYASYPSNTGFPQLQQTPPPVNVTSQQLEAEMRALEQELGVPPMQPQQQAYMQPQPNWMPPPQASNQPQNFAPAQPMSGYSPPPFDASAQDVPLAPPIQEAPRSSSIPSSLIPPDLAQEYERGYLPPSRYQGY